jgi:23S rRNA (uridine2552-2'-O)-methyltransferase
MKRSKSSRRWLDEHFSDHYVKESQRLGYRSRACFKLLEIQEKDKIIKQGMKIVDLGAAPGGWTQVCTQILKGNGRMIALDRLAMDPLEDVTFIEGDFTEDEVYQHLLDALNGDQVDCVLSDMAPNLSGQKAIDEPKALYLAELALEFCQQNLKPGGTFLLKFFQGQGFDQYYKTVKSQFDKVMTRKPKASRDRSKEVYVLAKGFRGQR